MTDEGNGARAASRSVVLVTWPDFAETCGDSLRLLESAGLEVRLAPRLHERQPHELDELLEDVVGAVVSTDPFTADVLRARPGLRVIARVGVGVDSIDVDVASERGVLVTVTTGANETTVADHTLALLLAAVRRIPLHDRQVRRGEWARTGDSIGWSLTGATVGLIGFGRIGRLVAQRLAGFDVRILVSDPVFTGDDLAEAVGLDQLLRRSDIVSLHAPLLPSTRGMLGERELGLLRPHAILINTGRGGIVDEAALVAALRDGRIRAAGIDVFDQEPPGSSPLLGLDNTVVTPHVAGISEESVNEMVTRAVRSVIDVVEGRIPPDVVNPAAFLARGEGVARA